MKCGNNPVIGHQMLKTSALFFFVYVCVWKPNPEPTEWREKLSFKLTDWK